MKKNFALFGYGKTTRAIANYFNNNCIFFDDQVKKTKVDEFGNIIHPSSKYNPNEFDFAITTPSLKPNHFLIQNTPNLFSEYDFFLSYSSPLKPQKIPFSIWISGTNGKTTTTQMLTHLLKDKGAISGGNIGTPLAALDQDAPIWILETSSFTLHHTKSASPNIYLLLPITPDHLSWHNGEQNYIKDKLSPLSRMQEGELALIPKGLPVPKSNAFIIEYETPKDIAQFFDIDINKVNFEGAFLLDALLALAATKTLFDEINYALINNFKLDAHRQEIIIDKFGRIWVNDSKATNIDATINAIKRFGKQKLHLILGGDDKGVDLQELFQILKQYDITIYTIGSNQEKLIALAKKFKIPYVECFVLDNALEKINKVHTKNSIALLSPAAASLDQFSSYKERGNKFKDYIKALS